MAITHGQVWAALDALAARLRLTPSGLAKTAGLDPTSFNRSKRHSNDTPPRPRWPSTESLAKVLNATGVSLADFATLAEPKAKRATAGGFAEAEPAAALEEIFPVEGRWDEADLSQRFGESVGLTVTGQAARPALRQGDHILLQPVKERLGAGERVVVRPRGRSPIAGEVVESTVETLVLRPFGEGGDAIFRQPEIAWSARILAVSLRR